MVMKNTVFRDAPHHFFLFRDLLVLWLLVAVTAAAETISVIDLNTNDDNSITRIESDQLIYEDYNEKYLVPYPSHDGNAVVNQDGGFFDKEVNFSGVTDGTIYNFIFYVTNTTPWNWSDYHFEFWDTDFVTRLAGFPLEPTVGLFSDQFTNDALAGRGNFFDSVAEFWAPGSHDVGEEGYYRLQIKLFDIFGSADGSFGIRQVATTPEPETILLLGIGVTGFVVSLRKKKQAAAPRTAPRTVS